MLNYPTKVDGVSTLPAAEYNDAATELKNAVTGTGLTLSSGDPLQFAKALTWEAQSGNFYTDSGTANSVILANSQAGTAAYRDGMKIRFRKGVTNTGPVSINVQGMGSVNLLSASGVALTDSALVAGRLIDADYKTAVGGFVVRSIENPTPIYVDTASRTIPASELNSLQDCRMSTGAITLTLPALSTVADGQYLMFIRDVGAFSLVIDGNGAENVGSRSTQELWGKGATLTVTKINGLWAITNSVDPSISVYMGFNGQSIANNVITTPSIDIVSTTGGLNSSWYNGSTFRITPQIAGDYQIHGRVSWSGSSAVGVRQIGILKNGVLVFGGDKDSITNAVSGVLRTAISVSYPIWGAVPGDYYDIAIYQNSGGALVSDFSTLTMTLLRRTI